jgi:hypothetical protein
MDSVFGRRGAPVVVQRTADDDTQLLELMRAQISKLEASQLEFRCDVRVCRAHAQIAVTSACPYRYLFSFTRLCFSSAGCLVTNCFVRIGRSRR